MKKGEKQFRETMKKQIDTRVETVKNCIDNESFEAACGFLFATAKDIRMYASQNLVSKILALVPKNKRDEMLNLLLAYKNLHLM